MEHKQALRIPLAILAALALIWLAHAVLPPPRARAIRIQAVNNLASTFPKAIVLTNLTLTNNNVPFPTR